MRPDQSFRASSRIAASISASTPAAARATGAVPPRRPPRRRRFPFLTAAVLGVLGALLLLHPGAGRAEETFTIRSIEPSDNRDEVTVRFTAPVEFRVLRENLKVAPMVHLYWHSSRSVGGDGIRLAGPFKRGETYALSLPDGLALADGRKYERTIYQFTMPNLPPLIAFAGKETVIERDSRQLLHTQIRNLEEILVETLTVPPLLLQAVPSGANLPLASAAAALEKERSRIAPVLTADPVFAPFIGPATGNRHLFFAKPETNADTRFTVPLTFRPNAQNGALLLVRLGRPDQPVQGEEMRLFRITDLALSYKQSKTGLAVWVTSLSTGRPVSGVSVLALDRDRRAYALGVSDRSGLIAIDAEKEVPRANLGASRVEDIRLYPWTVPFDKLTSLVAATGQDVTTLALEPRQWPKGEDRAALGGQTLRAHVFTERGAYRPGETVHFKATVRRYRDGEIIAPASETYRAQIVNPRGEPLYTREFELSEFGTLYDDVVVPGYARTGEYTLRVFGDTPERVVAETPFQVQEFREPRHQVDVTFRRETRTSTDYMNREIPEEILVCTITATYYTGGPVKHGEVRWKVYTTETQYRDPKHSNYHFGYPQLEDEDFLESAESMLDESGRIEIRVPLGRPAFAGRHGLRVAATVVDFDGRSAGGAGQYQVDPAYRVGVSRSTTDVVSGDPQTLRFMVLDARGRVQRSGNVNVKVMSRSYYWNRRRNMSGNVFWKWDDSWREEYQTTVALKGGEGFLDFTFSRGGQFLVQASWEEDGKEFVSGLIYNVRGPYYWGWWSGDRPPEPREFDTVQIIPDRNEYAVGDTMELVIRTRRRPAAAILAVERDGVLDLRPLKLDADTVRIKVTEAFKPNVYITVLATYGREGFPNYPGEYDDKAPGFAFGVLPVKVRNQVDPLRIAVEPDLADTALEPGDEQSFTLRVSSNAGVPVPAELAVAVVDERVLALTRYRTPSLAGLLDFQIPIDVFTGDVRAELLLQTPFRDFLNSPLTGGDGADLDERTAPTDSKIRKDFNPVAFYAPALHTDAEGRVTFRVTFPDSMTQYRLYAVACDTGSRVASHEQKIRVTRDFYLEPGLPAFLLKGDRFRFFVAAHNKANEAGSLSLGLTATAGLETTVAEPAREIPAHDRHLAPVDALAAEVGTATLTFDGTFSRPGAMARDRVENVIDVRHGHLMDYQSRLGRVGEQTVTGIDLPALIRETDWGATPPGGASCELVLSKTPLLHLRPALQYLLRYPYGCVEQTSSGIHGLAAVRTVVHRGLLPGIGRETIDEFLSKGVERVLGMQTAAGGFGYWPGDLQTNDWGSVYAMGALFLAREAGYPVSDSHYDKGLKYLENRLLGNQDSDLAATSAYLLAMAGGLPQNLFMNVFNRYGELDRENRLLLLLAAERAGYVETERLQTLLQEESAKPWQRDRDRWYRSVYREPALELMALLRLTPGTERAEQLADSLLKGQASSGRWSSTADTAWSLHALSLYFGQSESHTGPIRVELTLPAGETASVVLDGTEPHAITLDVLAFLRNPEIRLSTNADALVAYELQARMPRIDYARDGFRHSLGLNRTYENTSGDGPIRVGDVIKVRLRMNIPAYSYRHFALEDRLPAGFAAINSALASEEPMRQKDNREEYYWRYWTNGGYYNFVPDYFEIRDDRVLAFREEAWSGDWEYTYYARAICAGTFRAPSASAQLMYDPDVRAYTPETEIEILERPASGAGASLSAAEGGAGERP